MGYNKNYLVKVIARVDFLNEVNEFNKVLTDNLLSLIKKYYKIEDPKHMITKTITNVNGDTTTEHKNVMQWDFYNNTRIKHLCITSKFIFIEFNKYDNFEELEPFFEICDKIFEIYKNLKANRIGLRYIDEINLINVCELYKYSGYINEKLTNSFGFEEDFALLRNISVINMINDDATITFKYGIQNPDFPAINKKNIYTFDTDVYYQGIVSQNDLKSYFIKFKDSAKKIFDRAIDTNLEQLMDGEI